MGAQLGSDGAFNDINMTPLIDIVLVVLIIMMVNIPIQISRMLVKLPGKVTVQNTTEPSADQLVVAVYDDGKIALNRKLIPAESDVLQYELSRRLKPMKNKIVFIDAHPTVEYNSVVQLMDLARNSGAEKVSLAKMKEAGPLPYTSVAQGAIPRGITVGSPKVVGSITEKRAYEEMSGFFPVIEACYNAVLATNPTLSGRFILDVGIGMEGEIVSHQVISSNIEDPTLAQCVDEKVEAVKFTPLGRNDDGTGRTAAARYSILFSPG